MSTCSKRKSLPHLFPLVIEMAFQPLAPKVFKTPWPHSFLLLRTILGPGPAEPPILERIKKSWLCWECTWPLKQAGFVFRSIKPCSINPHQRWEAWERELLMTWRWHLGRGSLNLIKNHFRTWSCTELHRLPPPPSAFSPPCLPPLQSCWRCFASGSVFNSRTSCAWRGPGNHP